MITLGIIFYTLGVLLLGIGIGGTIEKSIEKHSRVRR